MGRIRTIKPEYWSHPIMARLPAETQLLALALLNHADDHGYFHADPAVIRGACCPFREDLATISRDLAKLSQAGWIEVREHSVQGDIGFVVNWSKHQKVDHPKPSKINTYYIRETVAKSSRELREVVALDQGSGIRDQGREQGGPRDTDFDDPIGEAPAPTAATDLILRQAPTDLAPDLREAWGRIAKDFGPEIATRARDAARRLFGTVSPKQLEQTFSCAHRRGCTHLLAGNWPDFTQQIRNDRAGLTGTQSPIDVERAEQIRRRQEEINCGHG